ncbi:MAG TPA: hypothetical protein DEQ30_10695 [Porphyromonadaceae bacterium]|nr:hypothetical protein [Porphyromonadaceae bacterium]
MTTLKISVATNSPHVEKYFIDTLILILFAKVSIIFYKSKYLCKYPANKCRYKKIRVTHAEILAS